MIRSAVGPSRALRHAGGVLLAWLVSGCGSPAPAPQEPPPALVRAVQPWRQPLDEWTEFPGTTQALPRHMARVTAAVEGRVLSVLPEGGGTAAEGERVREGQVVVQLDDRIARDNLARAEAAEKQAAAQEKQAATAVELARLEVERLRGLQKEGTSGLPLVSAVEIQKAEGALRSAQAQQQAAAANEASTAADVQALRRQVSLYTLRAPVAGWLSTVQVVPGQTVAVGTVVADVVDLDEIDVVCLVPPSRVGRVTLGEPAEVVGAKSQSPGQAPAPEGKVVYVAMQAEAETGSFPVKVRFPNRTLGLRANAVVRVRIRTAPPQERLVLPLDALRTDQEPPGVVTVTDLHRERGENVGKARLLQAVLGVENRQKQLVEVLSLEDPEHGAPVPPAAGTWFVVAGGRGLEDGDPVRVEEESHPAAPDGAAGAAAAGGR